MKISQDKAFIEKANIFSFGYLKCILLVNNLDDQNYMFTKKLLSRLIGTSHVLEDFLDFHGAKKNKQWVLYRELSATIRHLSLACYAQRHILNRFRFYLFDKEEYKEFEQQARDNLIIIQEAIKESAPLILQEAKCLSIDVPNEHDDLSYFPSASSVHRLVHDIDDSDSKNSQKENLTRIASEFLEIVKSFDEFAFYEPHDKKRIYEIVPQKINEVTIRKFEMLVHNLQSSFDSYVVAAKTPSENSQLEQFRSHFSIVYHLLQIMGRLLHFYERHLYNIRFKDVYKSVSQKLSRIIDPDVLLEISVNFCLFYAWKFLFSGKTLASEILNRNMEVGVIKVGIPEDRGFHSRPSLLVAKVVQHYGGEGKMHVKNDVFDASSVLDIQWAGGGIKKENIKIVKFKGDARALNDLKILASVNYGEDNLGKGIPLPKELSYLS